MPDSAHAGIPALLALACALCACGARSGLDAPGGGGSGGAASQQERLVLFGGWLGPMDVGDTWAFDGSAWTELQPVHSPSARNATAFAALGAEIVLFGGTQDGLGDGSILDETWVFAGGDWTQRAAAHTPSGRAMASAAALGGTMVFFSGFDGHNAQNDTWVWSGVDWSERIPSAPSGQAGSSPAWRNPASMATLGAPPSGARVVLFGGYGGIEGSPADLGDTWTWDAAAWAPQSPATSPSAREWAACATLGNVVVLFGDLNDFGVQGDTWTWDGTTWSQASPAGPRWSQGHRRTRTRWLPLPTQSDLR
jgi:hypothetical protein